MELIYRKTLGKIESWFGSSLGGGLKEDVDETGVSSDVIKGGENWRQLRSIRPWRVWEGSRWAYPEATDNRGPG